jgi:hypothetical protein
MVFNATSNNISVIILKGPSFQQQINEYVMGRNLSANVIFVFEADALLKFETNLKGKVENVNAPLSNKENNTSCLS